MAYDAFLKIDGVTGEATQAGHKGEIQISSFSLGASNPTNIGIGSGHSSGKVTLSDFSITKPTDSSSPTLFKNCCGGKPYTKVTAAIQKSTGAGGGAFLTYDFTNVYVTSVSWAGTGGAGGGGHDTPHETVTFTFEKVQITYKSQKSDGSLGAPLMAGWDLIGNQPT
jgi:type VI secretion system secreted protein Hcp